MVENHASEIFATGYPCNLTYTGAVESDSFDIIFNIYLFVHSAAGLDRLHIKIKTFEIKNEYVETN